MRCLREADVRDGRSLWKVRTGLPRRGLMKRRREGSCYCGGTRESRQRSTVAPTVAPSLFRNQPGASRSHPSSAVVHSSTEVNLHLFGEYFLTSSFTHRLRTTQPLTPRPARSASVPSLPVRRPVHAECWRLRHRADADCGWRMADSAAEPLPTTSFYCIHLPTVIQHRFFDLCHGKAKY
ncbi:uncharacterized protein K452DRAFT_130275 [Aplosporella prunicola CBS 121167]|uniref:Uncharacterized protein n=1 Tax=Aplosporella prunicola CBS 121167 TaxID=1176127 RepID=A0A6A6AXE5_9PEZI|nr:uncharacterized protein K452DRAFT_130275 [Aplosporella prunicola CBS 121167]KAF2136420.1 hypothetical protein K452DRAFT_130275 [Aplosporella prunicola CBS 121167]